MDYLTPRDAVASELYSFPIAVAATRFECGEGEIVHATRSCLGMSSRWQVAVAANRFLNMAKAKLLARLDHASGMCPLADGCRATRFFSHLPRGRKLVLELGFCPALQSQYFTALAGAFQRSEACVELTSHFLYVKVKPEIC